MKQNKVASTFIDQVSHCDIYLVYACAHRMYMWNIYYVFARGNKKGFGLTHSPITQLTFFLQRDFLSHQCHV